MPLRTPRVEVVMNQAHISGILEKIVREMRENEIRAGGQGGLQPQQVDSRSSRGIREREKSQLKQGKHKLQVCVECRGQERHVAS